MTIHVTPSGEALTPIDVAAFAYLRKAAIRNLGDDMPNSLPVFVMKEVER